MKILVLTALVVAVTSSRLTSERNVENQSTWSPWQAGKVYRYDVHTYTVARLQEGSNSGYAFQAQLILRVKANGQLQARLVDPKRATVHQELPEDWEEPNFKYEPIKNLEHPFEISFNGGRVVTLNLPTTLPLAHENMLKGLIGALQADLSTHRTVHNSQNTFNKEVLQGQFRKMETDVTGDCETLYTVSPVSAEWRRELPKMVDVLKGKEDPVEITKSKSYGHCHHRVAYHFGVPKGAEWTGTAHETSEEQFMTRKSTSRLLVARQGPIFKAETTNTVHVHPHVSGKQKAEVLSNVLLTLTTYEDDKEAEWQIPEATRLVKNLLYAMSSKQVTINENSSSSESDERLEVSNEESPRQKRSYEMPSKIVTINKVIINKRSKENSEDSSSSSDSSSAYVNDDIPESNEPVYASLYSQQNPVNAQKLVQELAQQLQNPNNMPKNDFLSKFNILVRVISSMSYEQLQQTSQSIEVAKSSNDMIKADMWMIYRDAVAQSGSLPAFQQIRTWIQKKRIQGEEAAQIVASMVNNLRYPTKEAMSELFKLAMTPEVREQEYLNSTALIAATRFINRGHVDNETAHSFYPTHMYGRLTRKHDTFVLDVIIPPLSLALNQAIEKGDSRKAQVYIKAIGNLGHPAILEVFTPYLEGKIQVTNYLRALMIDNLHMLAYQNDRYVRVVMYSILRNTAEPYEMRVAALNLIFLGHPTSAMIQAMAQMTHDDPSVHVRAALKSAIKTAAEMKNPRYWNLIRSAQAARDSLTKEMFGEQWSHRIHRDIFDRENDLGILSDLSYVGSEDSWWPKYLNAHLRSQTSGWQSVTASISSVKHFADYISQMWQHGSPSDPNHKFSASKISEMLNIKRNPQNPLEASFFINFMNQQRFFAVDEATIKQLLDGMDQTWASLSKGYVRHYTKVLNQASIDIVFPVATGMPFIYKYREPTVVHMQGKVKGDIKFPSKEERDYSALVDKEIQFTFATNIDGSVGFLDTLGQQKSTVGIVNKVQLNIPVKLQLQAQSRQIKIQLEPLHPNQDNTLVHYSVWPYSANQKQDSLVPVSLEPTTKLIQRANKVLSTDTKFGQSTGTLFQLQGYSYSSDYRTIGKMFQSGDIMSNIVMALYQKDVAMTHFNLRSLGKQSPTKKITLIATYDKLYNQKHSAQPPVVTKMEDVTPNSEARRLEMVKRVSSGIKTATARVADLSAVFEGQQKIEYVLTAAIGESPVDRKIQYAFFASQNWPQQPNKQINAVGTVNKPEVTYLNFLQSLQKDQKMTFEADIKFGENNEGTIQIKGNTDRTKKYVEELKKHRLGKLCVQQIAQNNYYQPACHKMIVMAHTPDHMKASVTYKDVSPAFRYMIYKFTRFAEQHMSWNVDVNPFKTLPDGKLEFEVQMNYLEKYMDMVMNSRYGEIRNRNIPITMASVSALSTYNLVKPHERVANYYSKHQYLPYCTIDNKIIRTFSDRSYPYTMSSDWHVVMQDDVTPGWQQGDKLVVMARRPSGTHQEIYISYKSNTEKELEIEILPGSSKPEVKVNTNAKKISEGDLTMYWDDIAQVPLLHYHTHEGVLVVNILEDRLRAMYDGQRLVIFSNEHRNNTRGLCGYMSGESRDDYMTPFGLVDQPDLFASLYALAESDALKQLQARAKEMAYQPQYKNTIFMADSEWLAAKESSEEVEQWNSNVYRTRSYIRTKERCQLMKQVQYHENHGEICITMAPLDSCQSHCKAGGHKVQEVQVVCRPKLDQQFQMYMNQIRQGQNPQVAGTPQTKQFKVPSTCQA